MADPLTLLEQRAGDRWLIGASHDLWLNFIAQRREELAQATIAETPPTVFLAESDPVRFLAGLMAACEVKAPVFLGNPHWTESERQQAIALACPDLVWGLSFNHQSVRSNPFRPEPGWIMIPTGGSSGQTRFVIHTWNTLTASVQGFQQHFQVQAINSCCVLPLYHVSGLMQFMRSFATGGQLVLLPFKTLEAGSRLDVDPTDFFLSLVPTQLQRLLHNQPLTGWLAQFYTVLLGGAPPWPELLDTARTAQIRLALTYGMTETASQVVTQQQGSFLNGQVSCGVPLPHATVTICNPAGEPLPKLQVGQITIRADSLALGYYPDLWTKPTFQPDDLGYWDEQGTLQVVGRNSNKIITGGENVFPAEVEAAIWATGLVTDVCVIGRRDRHWGEAVTAIYVPVDSSLSVTALQAGLQAKLSKFKQPKYWLATERLPRNAQGKLNRTELEQWIQTQTPDIIHH